MIEFSLSWGIVVSTPLTLLRLEWWRGWRMEAGIDCWLLVRSSALCLFHLIGFIASDRTIKNVYSSLFAWLLPISSTLAMIYVVYSGLWELCWRADGQLPLRPINPEHMIRSCLLPCSYPAAALNSGDSFHHHSTPIHIINKSFSSFTYLRHSVAMRNCCSHMKHM